MVDFSPNNPDVVPEHLRRSSFTKNTVSNPDSVPVQLNKLEDPIPIQRIHDEDFIRATKPKELSVFMQASQRAAEAKGKLSMSIEATSGLLRREVFLERMTTFLEVLMRTKLPEQLNDEDINLYYENLLKIEDSDFDIPILTVIFADINKLKEINDAYSHDKGDQVIGSAGKVIQQIFKRKVDLASLGIFEKSGDAGRYGGDEFVIAKINGEEYTDSLIDNFLSLWEEHRQELNLPDEWGTVSVGYHEFTLRELTGLTLLSKNQLLHDEQGRVMTGDASANMVRTMIMISDKAMYKAKKQLGEHRRGNAKVEINNLFDFSNARVLEGKELHHYLFDQLNTVLKV